MKKTNASILTGAMSGLIATYAVAQFNSSDSRFFAQVSGAQEIIQRAQSLAQQSPAAVVGAPARGLIRRLELRKDRVVFDDGDTISYPFASEEGLGADDKLVEFRLLGLDTPETFHPHHGIFYDQPKGQEASQLIKDRILASRSLELVTRGEFDKYRRILAHLLIDGENIAVTQIKAGLAYESISPFGDNGFPEMAQEIMDAWENHSPIRQDIKAGRTPAVLNPYLWRKRNQQHDQAVPLETWNALSENEKAQRIRAAKERAEGSLKK